MSKALLYAVIFALSTAVYAANDEETTQAPDVHAEFMKLDVNHDGVINAEEAAADPALDAVFDEISDDEDHLDEDGFADWKSSESNE